MTRGAAFILLTTLAASVPAAPSPDQIRPLGQLQGLSFTKPARPMFAGLSVRENAPQTVLIMIDDPRLRIAAAPIRTVAILQKSEIPVLIATIEKAERKASHQTPRSKVAMFSYRNKGDFELDATAVGAKLYALLTIGPDHRKIVIRAPEINHLKRILLKV